MSDINLRPAARALRAEVETLYGKAVVITEDLNLPQHTGGNSEVVEGGIPLIRLNPKTEPDETVIVHELFHLKMEVQGFPMREWERLVGVSEEINQELTKDLNDLLLDAILHSKFYPEMRKMGLDPDAGERNSGKAMMKISLVDGSQKILTKPVLIPLNYFKAYLEIVDRNHIAELEQRYEKNQLGTYLKTGRELVKHFEASTTNTPEQIIDVFVGCLNILLRDSARFDTRRWREEMLGTFRRRIVTIRILTPLKTR